MIKMVNLTPHEINFYTGDTMQFTLQPSGIVARASAQRVQIGTINGLPVYRVSYGQITGLPKPEKDTIYIVSSIVAQAVPKRADVYIVDGTVRDEAGKIIGCTGLAHI